MDSQNQSSGSYIWRINNFSKLTQKNYYSDVFTIGSCLWRMLIYPKGNNSTHLAIYLDVPHAAFLPAGWSREAHFTFTVVNQNDESSSTVKGTAHLFKAEQASWGYTRFMPLSHLHHFRRNLLINDTMIVKVEVDVLSVVPPIVFTEPAPHSRSDIARPDFDVQRIKETSYPPNAPPAIDAHMDMDLNRFDSIISKLEAFIIASKKKEGSSSGNDSNRRLADLISGSPSLEEVEEAKESLEECLSDIFRLDMKDRLATALLTLLRARVGLSVDQQKAIKAFWNNFDDFISGFLMFDQTNYEYELQKLTHDQMFCAMKKSHETHLLNMQLLEALTEEGQELKKRMDEINSRMEKLISEMESLMAEPKNMKSKYTAQEKKLAEAEEKKRVADERMSLSIAAWSSLKAQFLNPAAWL